jgi:two-component system, cell cycle sensor histidine kinase and response regulator CckA
VRYALIQASERRRLWADLRRREAALIEAERLAHIGSWRWDLVAGSVTWSEGLFDVFDVTEAALESGLAGLLALIHPDDRERIAAVVRWALVSGRDFDWEARIVRPDGEVRTISTHGATVRGRGGRVVAMHGVTQDVTGRRRAEDELNDRASQQREIAALGRRAIGGANLDELVAEAVEAVARTLGVEYAKVLELTPDQTALMFRGGVGWDPAAFETPLAVDGSHAGFALERNAAVIVEDFRRERRFEASEVLHRERILSGACVPVEGPGRGYGVLCAHSSRARSFTADELDFLQAAANVIGAATARDRADRLELQLRQAERLEAIGKLAGGIAHDFNNLLGVILNYADFALDEAGEAARADLEEIRKAAERGADLTRQLLTFSRRDLPQLEAVDVNDAIADTESMLRRTLGEDVALVTRLHPELSPVRLGTGQAEQILVNLAVNARDAMPSGGELTISTRGLSFADGERMSRLALAPGRYVELVIADTGDGMSSEVAAQAFDPFFTTKPRGQGTGLGLATVYGIVRQAGGQVVIDSAPEAGTEVRIYLPAATADRLPAARRPETSREGDSEVILLVEDEGPVRRLAERILAGHGYRVLAAENGDAALEACREHDGPIDLLLTDVIMPGLSGAELAQQARLGRPELAVLYMSGYTGDVIARTAALDPGAPLIEKPFTSGDLLVGVERALDPARARDAEHA